MSTSVESQARLPLHERLVGVFVYMLGLTITIQWGGDLIHHTAWTTTLPIQLGNMLIGAGGALAIWGWRR